MAEQLKDAPAHGLTTIDKLRMLLDITKKISRSLDLQEVLNLVMDTLDSLIPYDAAGIFVVDCEEGGPGGDNDKACVFKSQAGRGDYWTRRGDQQALHLGGCSQGAALHQRARGNAIRNGRSHYFERRGHRCL